MKVNLSTIVPLLDIAIQENINSFQDEPDSDGDTKDQWEEIFDVLEILSETWDEFKDAFDEGIAVRSSLGRKNIEIKK